MDVAKLLSGQFAIATISVVLGLIIARTIVPMIQIKRGGGREVAVQLPKIQLPQCEAGTTLRAHEAREEDLLRSVAGTLQDIGRTQRELLNELKEQGDTSNRHREISSSALNTISTAQIRILDRLKLDS